MVLIKLIDIKTKPHKVKNVCASSALAYFIGRTYMFHVKRLTILALSPLFLAACATNGISSMAASSGNVLASSSATSSAYPTTSWDGSKEKINDGFVTSGIFIDIGVGTPLVAGITYDFPVSFSDGSISSAGASISSSNESVLSFEVDPNNASSFKGTAHQVGDVVIAVKDSTGYRHYRNLVTIRKGLKESEMDDYLAYSVSYFESDQALSIDTTSDIKMTFLGDNKGQFSGTFEGAAINSDATFTYTRSAADDVEDYYGYTIGDFTVKSTSFSPAYFRIHKTGFMLHLLDEQGLLGFLRPVVQ